MKALFASCLLCVLVAALPARTSSAQGLFDDEAPRSARLALRTALSFLQQNPERRANFVPASLSLPGIADEVLTQYRTSDGEQITTRLYTTKSVLLDLGTSLRWGQDKQNMLRFYRSAYFTLPPRFRGKLERPSALRGKSVVEVKRATSELLNTFSRNIEDVINRINPALLGETLLNPIGFCEFEDGYGVSGPGSELSERCELSEYEPDGLFINNEFPLKDDLTCVKDQGSRGTCVAHAIAAAVETLALVDGGPAKNLSEQHLYHQGETKGDARVSLLDLQLYNIFMDIALVEFTRQNVGIYYERDWHYNRGIGMGNPVLNSLQLIAYPNSCSSLYVGPCTDYVWQSGVSVSIPGIPNPDPPPPTGPAVHTISSNFYFPMDGGGVVTTAALYTAIAHVAAEIPVLLGFAATDSFRSTLDGYVRNIGIDQVLGGHAMILVGFVPNSELPEEAIPATEEGYFIAKNSWGINSGDCGFYYIDFGYLRDHAFYLNVVDI